MARSPTTEKEQTIEDLQKRYQGLHTRKIQAETQRDEARRQLDKLQAEALAKYGTDDLPSLQKQLEERVAENARQRADYQTHLDQIERGLAEVEHKFGSASTAPTSSVTTSGAPPIAAPPLNASLNAAPNAPIK